MKRLQRNNLVLLKCYCPEVCDETISSQSAIYCDANCIPQMQGMWKPSKIANPDYFEDKQPLKNLADISAVAVEIWTMDEGYYFDNVLVSNHAEKAQEYREKYWARKHEHELVNPHLKKLDIHINEQCLQIQRLLGCMLFGLDLWYAGLKPSTATIICRESGNKGLSPCRWQQGSQHVHIHLTGKPCPMQIESLCRAISQILLRGSSLPFTSNIALSY